MKGIATPQTCQLGVIPFYAGPATAATLVAIEREVPYNTAKWAQLNPEIRPEHGGVVF
jgi:hypothetical protein